MASNQLMYKDLTPAKPLDKKTINHLVWKSTMLQASFNYERMQAAGWLWSILPGLEKIHTNKEDLSASMSHNLEFFNTHTYTVTFVMGIVLSLEQQKAEIGTIRAVRVAAMGPLGGIGDALIWFTLYPIAAGICANMAINGNPFGSLLYFIVVFGAQMALRYWLFNMSYSLGTSAISVLTKRAKEFTHTASMLGVFVVGAITCNYGATALGIMIPNGTTLVDGEEVANYIDVQGLINGILPAMVPLMLTLMCYYLVKKRNWTPTRCIFLLLVLGIVGCAIGIWASSDPYTPLISVPWKPQ